MWFPAILLGGLGMNWQAAQSLNDVDGTAGGRRFVLDSKAVFALGFLMGLWTGCTFGSVFDRWWRNFDMIWNMFFGESAEEKRRREDEEARRKWVPNEFEEWVPKSFPSFRGDDRAPH